MVTLNMLIQTLISLNADTRPAENAISELEELQKLLNEKEVKGRDDVDKLLGCMLGIDAIIGKDGKANG